MGHCATRAGLLDARGREVVFCALVSDEEERGARSRARDHAADSFVHARPPAVGEEAAGGLEARFEGVEREEGEVDGGAGEAAGLHGVSGVGGGG